MKEIENLLRNSKFPTLYSPGMETQVIVDQGLGEPKEKGFTDGIEFWHNFRTPYKGYLRFTLEKHALAIGMSGWNFIEKKSYWVGFDFDSIVNHKKGLTEGELTNLIERVKDIDWISIRRSTSGKGLHLYVWIATPILTDSRREHAQLARSILSTLSGLLAFDFKNKVDTSGGILWQWHKRSTGISFQLVKEAVSKFVVGENWRDAIPKKSTTDLVANIKFTDLDEDHSKLLKWFAKRNNTWWWDSELNMLVCHTSELAIAHKELAFRGLFFTNSTGKDAPSDQNCFAFPLSGGAWIVRRHSIGTNEHQSWKQDSSGWTYCYFNRIPTLDDLSGIYGGILDEKKNYVFNSIDDVKKVLAQLSPSTTLDIPLSFDNRNFRIKNLPDSKVLIKCDRYKTDNVLPGWVNDEKKVSRVINIIEEKREMTTPDDQVRHVISGQLDAGWYINIKNKWVNEPVSHISHALSTLSYNAGQIKELLGQCILNPWHIVNRPFEKEYPGNREWNMFSPQLLYEPIEGPWDKWNIILSHLGKNLDEAVHKNSWCITYNIRTGAEYLKYWVASVFQYPTEPLPYLFLYGPQLSGKTTLHESLGLLVNKGVVQAKVALTSQQNFNGELLGAIICVVEELNLRIVKGAYDRVKDWVTARTIVSHEKGKTPIEVTNSTHWIQCANNSDFCPIQIGDTRILMIKVDKPDIIMSREKLTNDLKSQAAAFLYEILNLEIPSAIDRLRVPLLETADKLEEQIANANLVEQFIIEKCFIRKGQTIPYKDFCNKFELYSGQVWSSFKIHRAIPLTEDMPVKGKIGADNEHVLGNITFDEGASDLNFYWAKNGDRLIKRGMDGNSGSSMDAKKDS